MEAANGWVSRPVWCICTDVLTLKMLAFKAKLLIMPTYCALHYNIAFKHTNKTPSIRNRTERCASEVHSLHCNCNTMFCPLNQTRDNTLQNAYILCYSNPLRQLFCFTDLFLLCCADECNHLTIQPYNLDIIWYIVYSD